MSERAPDLRERPNLVLIVTDQERASMHWPDGLVEERLHSGPACSVTA